MNLPCRLRIQQLGIACDGYKPSLLIARSIPAGSQSSGVRLRNKLLLYRTRSALWHGSVRIETPSFVPNGMSELARLELEAGLGVADVQP